jgi:hypothetical protein
MDKEISYCQQGYEPKQCRLDVLLNITMVAPTCTGVSHADWKEGQSTHSTTSAVRRADIKTASDDAISECVKTAPRENCKLLAAVCADGSSQTGALEIKP